jgi:hypothetical protein
MVGIIEVVVDFIIVVDDREPVVLKRFADPVQGYRQQAAEARVGVRVTDDMKLVVSMTAYAEIWA